MQKIRLFQFIIFAAGFLFAILSALPVSADYLVQMRNGNTLSWASYSIEDGNYCTWALGGRICLPVGEVASIKEVEVRLSADEMRQMAIEAENERIQQQAELEEKKQREIQRKREETEQIRRALFMGH